MAPSVASTLQSHKTWLGVATVTVFGLLVLSSNGGTRVDYHEEALLKRGSLAGGLHPARPPPFVGTFKRRQETEVCSTDACKSFADSVIKSRALNYTGIDPCTDFATYTCGNWWDTHDYRDDQSSVGTLSVMSDVNTAIMRAILESPYSDNSTFTGDDLEADKEIFDKMIAAYDSCMDTDTIDALGAKPLQDLFAKYEEESSDFDLKTTDGLTNALIWLLKYGGSGIISAQTWADDKNPNITTIGLGNGAFGMDSKEYYNDTESVANYTVAIVGMFDILFGEEKHDTHASLAKELIDLETALIYATPDPSKAGDVEYYYNVQNLTQVDASIPEISVSKYLKAFVPSNYTLSTAIVLTPEYFPAISPIIANASAETLDAYIKWVLIQNWVTRLSNDANAPYRRFQNELTGKDPEAIGERWTTCLADVDANLPWIESAFFVQVAFSPEAKIFGDRIISDIEDIFMEKLQGYEWMSASVKTKAIQKVLNMVEKIGYPDKSPNVTDPVALSNLYAPLAISNTSYFDNGLAYVNFSTTNSWKALLHPTDKDIWFMTTPTVNAYFNPPSNEIAFPAGIMQQPLFNLDLPEYVSYGAFGAVAGHELTHSFDNSGSHYDENGAYTDWWDNSTLANFEKKTSCFVDQYSKYSIVGPTGESLNVNGELTLGENIADGGGLNAAFAAWKKVDAEKPNPGLTGLEEYTTEQLFYLSFGGVWCGKGRPAELVRRIRVDPHSPMPVRILGTVANQQGFKEAFNCPVKEPTCELW
ncbi:zincin [Pleomassaria siparia CBS 279.74]|uniref:Zincin n=1 Tax=Pleomassaria siparia CBS 279.74 TaxID=1314801 RepID=A0A6G1KQ97_9PLEO|nr:zincin [Pleomassaria siparia CBS 279.74]